MEVWPGQPYPLGATFDGSGTNFALFSEVAEQVELCLFDDDRARDPGRAHRGGRVRLALLPAIGAARPALRLPRARAVGPGEGAALQPREAAPRPLREGHRRRDRLGPVAVRLPLRRPGLPQRRRLRAPHDLGVVINPFFDWEGDRRLDIPYNETLIYEAHVKGLTQLHPDVPEDLRGTYAGLAHPAVTEHLTRLGRHRDRADAGPPVRAGLHAARQGPAQLLGLQHPGRSSPRTPTTPPTGQLGQQVQEFKSMVKAMHEAGIEVILDVVYNHTAEGNHLGPDAELQGHRQPGVLPARRGRRRATTWTTPAPGTPSTSGTRTRCS